MYLMEFFCIAMKITLRLNLIPVLMILSVPALFFVALALMILSPTKLLTQFVMILVLSLNSHVLLLVSLLPLILALHWNRNRNLFLKLLMSVLISNFLLPLCIEGLFYFYEVFYVF